MRTLFVGIVLTVGAMLFVVGSSLVDAIRGGMQQSLIRTVTGHLQLYSAKSRDQLTLLDASVDSLEPIASFSTLRAVVSKVDNVKYVVPMGIGAGIATSRNIFERRLTALRDAVRAKAPLATRATLLRQVRRLFQILDKQLAEASKVEGLSQYLKSLGDVATAFDRGRQPAFWKTFWNDPLDALEYLENKVAPLALGEKSSYLPYIATDTALFNKAFDRLVMVKGRKVPDGKRGIILAHNIYEGEFKNDTARRLDRMSWMMGSGHRIASSPALRGMMAENMSSVPSLVLELSAAGAARVEAVLGKVLGSQSGDLTAQMRAFMRMNDKNFRKRVKIFYRDIAPHIALYTVPIGGQVIMTAMARSGFVRRVPVTIYGTFRFSSLDLGMFGKAFNILDLVSFRELYGFPSKAQRDEAERLRRQAGIRKLSRAEAEKALFGGSGGGVGDDDNDKGGGGGAASKPAGATSQPAASQPASEPDLTTISAKYDGQGYTAKTLQRVYSKDELWNGLVINAAVVLADGRRLQQTATAVRAALKKAGLAVRVIDWRAAAGQIGRVVRIASAVVYGGLIVVLFVSMIILSNVMLMSVTQRTQDIGTMRAIGAQRSFVRGMLLLESSVLALICSAIGSGLGLAFISWLGAKGIAARSTLTRFLFSGPSLHPTATLGHAVTAVVVVVIVALVSTYYPARLATKVSPREAMGASS
ncbi:MAG: FtsX-like permease family protein [Myxococcales bacterium]|nr:FtsX-like permease family protein [Myxococcales bacterium]